MPRKRSILFAVFAAMTASGTVAHAQNRGGRAGRGTIGADQAPLARRVREAWGGVVRRQLHLSAEKWQQFDRVDRKFEQQRNQLRRDERQARLGLKAAMEDTTNVDQNKISQYMDQLTQAQRRRADILDSEQKELAGFLTPLQRAKLLSLREQLNQRVRDMQQGGNRGRRGEVP